MLDAFLCRCFILIKGKGRLVWPGQISLFFSHLPWKFVYQRPQHLLSRLAATRRVIFIQEPEYRANEQPNWSFSDPQPGVTVAQPRTPIREHGFHDDQIAAIESLMNELYEQLQVDDHIAWFYTPLAIPLIAIWQIVMVGPVVKISPDSLPRLPNIHYLGQKQYSELPNYLAGWDV
jgi:hypothetical protein